MLRKTNFNCLEIVQKPHLNEVTFILSTPNWLQAKKQGQTSAESEQGNAACFIAKHIKIFKGHDYYVPVGKGKIFVKGDI